MKIQVLAYRRRARFDDGPGHIGVSFAMEGFVAQHGWSIERIFVDGGPAPKVGMRLEMQHLIASIDPEAAERHVLIDSFDRLDRRVEHAVALVKTLQEKDVQIHSMDGMPVDAQLEMALSLSDAVEKGAKTRLRARQAAGRRLAVDRQAD